MTSLPGAFLGGILVGIIQSVATSADVFEDIPGTPSHADRVPRARSPCSSCARRACSGSRPDDADRRTDRRRRPPRRRSPPAPFRPSAGGLAGPRRRCGPPSPTSCSSSRSAGRASTCASSPIAVCYGIVALSLNVLLGYVGQISLGHAGVRRHRRVHVGLHRHRAGPVVLGRRARPPPPSAAPRRWSSAACRCASAASTSRSSRCRTGWSPSRTSSRSRSSPAAAPASGRPSPTGSTPSGATTTCAWPSSPSCCYVDWRMMRTKAGRALLALRENPRVASTFGINVPHGDAVRLRACPAPSPAWPAR